MSLTVRAEQIRTLYRRSFGIMVVNPVNAAIVGTVLWPSEPHALVAGWVAAAVLVTALRASLRGRYLRAEPPPEAAPAWARRFVAGSAVAGLVWGLGGALLYDPHVVMAQLILVFVIGGMIAGAAGTLAYHLPAFRWYAALAVLPVSARIMAEGDRLHVAMGALTLIYGAAMALVAANTHRALAEAFRLRFENDDLLVRLSTAQISLAEVNRTLEQRVAERGAALERQEEALREARRMESLGLLAGGVAHDFNNLLTVILGNVLMVMDRTAVPADARGGLEEIRRATERAATLVSQLLAFSRRQVMVPRVLDLNRVVSDLQRLLARLIGEHIEMVVSLQAGPLPVEADPVQIEQVIINLATNARDAMPDGGRLTIETSLTEIADGEAPSGVAVAAGAYATITVRDTGVGMDAETRRMAFHPFFTTKEVGHGTGLGLATVYGIVEQSGGRVLVDSAPGQGSCFSVFLPRASGPIAAAAAAAPPAATAETRLHAPATALVAEDDPEVRAVTVKALGAAGFTVIEAENGEQALDRARLHDGAIDVLVTDVVMSKMGGPDLARRLVVDRPEIRVLFVSGYSGTPLPPMSDAPGGSDFLGKPFTPEVLVERARRLLARGGPAPRSPQPPAKAPGAKRLA